MSYKKGDRLYHPVNGAGIYEGTSETEVAGIKMKVMEIALMETRATQKIPLTSSSAKGLRRASAPEILKRALRVFDERPTKGFKKSIWVKRINEFSEKINSGDPVQIAEATRDVYMSARSGELSHTGRTIYERGRNRLAMEMAEVFGEDATVYEKRIDEAIAANPGALVPVSPATA